MLNQIQPGRLERRALNKDRTRSQIRQRRNHIENYKTISIKEIPSRPNMRHSHRLRCSLIPRQKLRPKTPNDPASSNRHFIPTSIDPRLQLRSPIQSSMKHHATRNLSPLNRLRNKTLRPSTIRQQHQQKDRIHSSVKSLHRTSIRTANCLKSLPFPSSNRCDSALSLNREYQDPPIDTHFSDCWKRR